MALRRIKSKNTDVLIRLILDHNGWTLQMLAELLGVSKAKMSLCLSGERTMPAKQIAILQKLFVPELDAEKLCRELPASFDIPSSPRAVEDLMRATEIKRLKVQKWLLRREAYQNKHAQATFLLDKQVAYLKKAGLPNAMVRTLLIRRHAAAANQIRHSPTHYFEMKGQEVALTAQLEYYKALLAKR